MVGEGYIGASLGVLFASSLEYTRPNGVETAFVVYKDEPISCISGN